MGEMINRVATWLHQREGDLAGEPAKWQDLPEEHRAALVMAAKDLVATMRRPTLGMRVGGRSAKGDEGDIWRAMIDGTLSEAE